MKNRFYLPLIMLAATSAVYSWGPTVNAIPDIENEISRIMILMTRDNANTISQQAYDNAILKGFRMLTSQERYKRCLEYQIQQEPGRVINNKDAFVQEIHDVTIKAAKKAHRLHNAAELLKWYANALQDYYEAEDANTIANIKLENRFKHQKDSDPVLYHEKIGHAASALIKRNRTIEAEALKYLKLSSTCGEA